MKQVLVMCCLVAACGCCCEDIPIFCPPTPTPPIPLPPESRKVAVLISTDFAENEVAANAGFWYDTVLTYCMLRHNGFEDEDIWVIYGQGSDGFYALEGSTVADYKPQSSLFYVPFASGPANYYLQPTYCDGIQASATLGELSVPGNITDLPITFPDGHLKATVDGVDVYRPQQLFTCLEKGCDPNIVFGADRSWIRALSSDKDNSFLFVWWRGHGYPVDKTDDLGNITPSATFTLAGGTGVTANEIVSWISGIDAGHRLLVFDTCSSGCLDAELEDIEDTTVFFASAACEDDANFGYVSDVHHAVWTFWLAGALQGALPNAHSSVIPVPGPPPAEMAINLQYGGPLSEIFTESNKATTLLFEGQQPKICSPDNLAQRMKLNWSEPVLPATSDPAIE